MLFLFVLSMLILSPDHCENLFSSFITFLTDPKFVKIKVRSSANMLSLIVLLLMLLPFILFSNLILFAKTSMLSNKNVIVLEYCPLCTYM